MYTVITTRDVTALPAGSPALVGHALIETVANGKPARHLVSYDRRSFWIAAWVLARRARAAGHQATWKRGNP